MIERKLQLASRNRFRGVDLPVLDELQEVEELFPGPEGRLLLPIVLLTCRDARKSEIGRLLMRDIIELSRDRLQFAVRAKGGKVAVRSLGVPLKLRSHPGHRHLPREP